jgi:hypothetical protein
MPRRADSLTSDPLPAEAAPGPSLPPGWRPPRAVVRRLAALLARKLAQADQQDAEPVAGQAVARARSKKGQALPPKG